MFVACGASVDDLMREVIEEVRESGQAIRPSKGSAREVVGVMLKLTDPRARLSRSESRSTAFSGLGELLWYMSGSDAVAPIGYYFSMYEHLHVEGRVEGAYGPRLFGASNRLAKVIGMLRDKPDSRQAVVQIFEHEDLDNERDVPCTSTIQFFLRDGRLDVVVHMRSNDAYRGLPHDVFCFTMLQEIVARAVGSELGSYVHMVGSLHIYDRDAERAQSFVSEGWQGQASMPPMPEGDPFPAVSSLLATERGLRLGEIDAPTAEVMDLAYWSDFAVMLWAFSASKRGPADLNAIASGLRDDYFKIYLTDRRLKVEGTLR